MAAEESQQHIWEHMKHLRWSDLVMVFSYFHQTLRIRYLKGFSNRKPHLFVFYFL